MVTLDVAPYTIFLPILLIGIGILAVVGVVVAVVIIIVKKRKNK